MAPQPDAPDIAQALVDSVRLTNTLYAVLCSNPHAGELRRKVRLALDPRSLDLVLSALEEIRNS
jgi:hypothetical protein